MKSAPNLMGPPEPGQERSPVLLPPINVMEYEGPAAYIAVNKVRPVDIVASARVAIEGLVNLSNRDMVMTGRKTENANIVILPRRCPVADVPLIERYTGVAHDEAVRQSHVLARAYKQQIDLFRSCQATADSNLALRYMGKITHCGRQMIELLVKHLSLPQNVDRRIERLMRALDGFATPLMAHWCDKEFVPTGDVELLTVEVMCETLLVEFLPLLLEGTERTDSTLIRFINANTSDRHHEISSAGWFKKRAETAALRVLKEFVASRTRSNDACALLIAFEKANLISAPGRQDALFVKLREVLRKFTAKGFAEKHEVYRILDQFSEKAAVSCAKDLEVLQLLRKYLQCPEKDPNYVVSIAVRLFTKEMTEVALECIEDNIGTYISDIIWRKLPKLAYHLSRQDPKTSDDFLKIIRDLVRYFQTENGQHEKLYFVVDAFRKFYHSLFHGLLEQVSASEFPIVEMMILLTDCVRSALENHPN